MIIRLQHLSSLLICALLITACEKSTVVPPPPNTSPHSSVVPTQKVDQIGEAAKILTSFKKEMSVCVSAMKLIETDPTFIKDFSEQRIREVKPLEDFLRQTTFAKNDGIQYILKNQQYFIIDVDFHGNAFAVATIKWEPIYCALPYQRLREIEEFGESLDA